MVTAGSVQEIVATASLSAFMTADFPINDVNFEVTIDGATFGGGIGFSTTLHSDRFNNRFVHDSGAVVFRVTGLAPGPHTFRLIATAAPFNSTFVTILLPSDNGSLYVQDMLV